MVVEVELQRILKFCCKTSTIVMQLQPFSQRRETPSRRSLALHFRGHTIAVCPPSPSFHFFSVFSNRPAGASCFGQGDTIAVFPGTSCRGTHYRSVPTLFFLFFSSPPALLGLFASARETLSQCSLALETREALSQRFSCGQAVENHRRQEEDAPVLPAGP